jgi:hypothetical protein
MEISKFEVRKIDNHLKSQGIKYWDLRLEMIDHIVTNMEIYSEYNNFEQNFKSSLKHLGWHGNLAYLNREGWQNVNKKYRREYYKGFINFFKKPKNILIFIICLLIYYFFSENVNFKFFDQISYLLFISPLILVLIVFLKTLNKKYGKSVNLDYGVTYMIMSFLILNTFPLFWKEQSLLAQKIGWFIILPIHFIAFYSGYNLYKKAIVKIDEMRKHLLN